MITLNQMSYKLAQEKIFIKHKAAASEICSKSHITKKEYFRVLKVLAQWGLIEGICTQGFWLLPRGGNYE